MSAPDKPGSSPVTPRARPHISTVQVLASALAAVTATVAASYLGVAGTVIGAAVASVLTVIGNAIYAHSIQRGAQRWIPPRAPAPLPEAVEPAPASEPSSVKVLGAAAVGVFVGVLLVVTLVEVIAGKPLSDLLEGKKGSGTSITGGNSHSTKKTPVPTVTVTASAVVVTPTVTFTANTVTATATPTITVTPSATATGTSTPTPSSSSASSSPTAVP